MFNIPGSKFNLTPEEHLAYDKLAKENPSKCPPGNAQYAHLLKHSIGRLGVDRIIREIHDNPIDMIGLEKILGLQPEDLIRLDSTIKKGFNVTYSPKEVSQNCREKYDYLIGQRGKVSLDDLVCFRTTVQEAAKIKLFPPSKDGEV